MNDYKATSIYLFESPSCRISGFFSKDNQFKLLNYQININNNII